MDLKISTVENQCSLIANQIAAVNFSIDDNTNSVSTQIDQLAVSFGGRLIVMNKNYRILKDTYTGYQGRYFLSSDVIQIMNGKKKKIITYPGEYMELMIPVVYENSKNDEILGIVMADVSMADIIATKDEIRTQRALLSTVFILIGISLAALLSVLLTRDFKKVEKNLKYIAMGHEDELVEEVGSTEMKTTVQLFNDILSKIQVLEDSRQEFVSNVSHELKTPMTSMKVLADSLLAQEGMPEEVYREFLTDIVEEIDRENEIITDLLSLVKLDKKAAKVDIKATNINELLEVILKRIKPLAQKRNIEMTFESFRPVTAEVDQIKLSLAFSNLIENAVKYNKDDGWIRVSLNADHKYFYVKVADSGVGIPEDCQDQVFERFYRVDKARSRKTGGTGLGLAITRNAILVHKGAIKLYSKEGEGTTFTVRIPLNYHA
ncbi:MAG: ATP-binding protein [Lachnospiraceae bacterium]|nr:ATP-binding protein [Lachnospiraceae bacterium]